MSKKWLGITLICLGIATGFFGCTLSIENAPVLVTKGCTPFLAMLSACDRSIHSVTGIFAVGLWGSIALGIIMLLVGLVVALSEVDL